MFFDRVTKKQFWIFYSILFAIFINLAGRSLYYALLKFHYGIHQDYFHIVELWLYSGLACGFILAAVFALINKLKAATIVLALICAPVLLSALFLLLATVVVFYFFIKGYFFHWLP